MLERRRYVRWRCSLASSFKERDSQSSRYFSSAAMVQDLSIGGARLRLSHFIPMTQDLILHLKIPGQPELVVRAKPMWFYELRHLNCYDVGIEFKELDTVSRQMIEQSIRRMAKGSEIKGEIEE